MLIKTSYHTLEQNQNVIYFADLEDEYRFIFSINSLWAIISGRIEITLLEVSLNNDLSSRLVHWDKVSEEVINDITPPPSPTAKKQSIASMQAVSSADRRHKAIELFNEEASMDFAGLVYKRDEQETVCTVTVWKRYAPLLLSINSLSFTIENQFWQIGRTKPLNQEVVSIICQRVLEEHLSEE